MDNELIPQKSWWSRNWKWVVPVGGCLTLIIVVVILIASVFYGVTGMLKNSTPYEEAFETASTNEQVLDALGEPIEQDGIFKGSINIENDGGKADIEVPIKGPNGSAVLHVVGEKQDGNWSYSTMTVTLDGSGEVIYLNEEPF